MADQDKQLLHIVIGGELKSVDSVEFRDLAKVELVGAYPNYAAAHTAWRAKALLKAGARHVRTRPYTPRTNGKAERFIQTSLREWAYAKPYACSDERAAAIGPWTTAYNLTRPHTGIGGLTPWQRVNNLLGNDT